MGRPTQTFQMGGACVTVPSIELVGLGYARMEGRCLEEEDDPLLPLRFHPDEVVVVLSSDEWNRYWSAVYDQSRDSRV